MRFFQRALETYQNGLQRFPESLDLAYNRARLLYDMYSNPLTRRQLQSPVQQLLEEALSAHRYALSLDTENADTLFNTAQVLTTIAEELLTSDRATKVFELLQEAVQIQAKCISIQERKFEDNRQQRAVQEQLAIHSRMMSRPSSTTEPSASNSLTQGDTSQSDDDGVWAAVVEPVTADTLIDTAVAQLYTLRTLCEACTAMHTSQTAAVIQISSFAADVKGASDLIMTTKLPKYLIFVATATNENLVRRREVSLAHAVFSASFLELSYRMGTVDFETYTKRLDAASYVITSTNCKTITTTGDTGFDAAAALIAQVQSHQTLAIAAFDHPRTASAEIRTALWPALNSYIILLSDLAKDSPKLSPSFTITPEEVYNQLAETTLLLRRLAAAPFNHSPAITNEQILLRNAATHYGNVIKLRESELNKINHSSPLPLTSATSPPPANEDLERVNVVRRRREIVHRLSSILSGQASSSTNGQRDTDTSTYPWRATAITGQSNKDTDTTPRAATTTELEAEFREMVDEGLLNEHDALSLASV